MAQLFGLFQMCANQ